jgi:hypothetical protein
VSWIKWHVGTVDDPKFRVVSRKSRVTVRDVVTVWASILECAGTADERGSIAGMDREAVTLSLELEQPVFEAILEAMQGRLLDGDRVKNWGKRQTQVVDPTAAERKRRQRERDRVTESHVVTHRDDRDGHTDKNREEENREDSYTGDFEECWSVYPKRSGSNDKRAAFKAWSARLKEGHKPADIIAGTKRYATWCRSTGKEHTEMVKQAATFLGPADPPHFTLEHRSAGQPAPAPAELLPMDESLKPFLKKMVEVFGIASINTWFATARVVEKDDWITILVSSGVAKKALALNYSSHIRLVFGDQVQIHVAQAAT